MRVDTDSVASCLSDSVFLTSAGCELTELKASVGFSSFSRFSDVGTVRAEISKYNTFPFLLTLRGICTPVLQAVK